jgi:dihydrodipicolinate reductase
MYGKGPGSLEYAAALERADAAGRSMPIEEDYLASPPITTDVVVEPTINQKVDDFVQSTGMANIPPIVSSTGQSHKDFEIQQRQEQGAYIPPGMTTSDGVPVEAQAGGQQSLYDSDRAAWLHNYGDFLN